jgi:hypothetical protein
VSSCSCEPAWLSPSEVGQLVGGFSAQFIRSEIRAGELTAAYIWSRGGRRARYRIARAEADAYRERLLARKPLQTTQSDDSNV